MSCFLFWCCRGPQSDSDTEHNANEQLRRDGDKIKRKKKWRARKTKGQQKKEETVDAERAEEVQAAQQPAAGEKGNNVPYLPAGSSLENISTVTPEKMRTLLHGDSQSIEDIPETSRDLTENLQDQTEAETEAEAIKLLDDEEADNNQPLENEKLKKMAAEAEAEFIQEIMSIYLDETEETVEKHLENEKLMTAEAEATDQLTSIHLDETEDTIEKHLGYEVLSVADTKAEASTDSIESHLDENDTPTDQPLGDEMTEVKATEGAAQVIKDLVHTDLQDTYTESLVVNSVDTEAEAIRQQMQIDGDQTETPNDQPLDAEKKSDAETDWLFNYEPIKSWADYMEEIEDTIDDAVAEIEAWKIDFPVNEDKTDQQEVNIKRGTCRNSQGTAYKGHKEERAYGKRRTQPENAGTCERAPHTDPQQWRAQRKENRREMRHWMVEHQQRTLRAPPEEKSAPQIDYRQNRHQAYGKRRTQPENAGTCERAPDTDPQQWRAQRKEYRREMRHWMVEHQQRTLQAPPEEKSAPQIDYRQNRHQEYGKRRTQPENAGTCERAPDTDPQQRRAQRKEYRRETRQWAVKHLQKTLQDPREEKSAPQRDCRQNTEGLRVRTAEFRQKTHPRPADNQTDRGTHSSGRRIDEYGRRGAAQCWQSRLQRRDAPQTPPHNGERVSERAMKGKPAQCTPGRTMRNDRTARKPQWWQHDDRSVEAEERETKERHQDKKFRNGNRQWKNGRRTDASY
ncbi:hypothetical protein MHYP_G00318890 [Metynnis hypsauchen]